MDTLPLAEPAPPVSVPGPVSAIAWPAILGGAVAAAAITLVLLVLGSGFGLASISPWPALGISTSTFTIAAGIWLIVIQWAASALGGYITGRLRVRWIGTHAHEVFFRDTAHGLLTWALVNVAGAALLAVAASSAGGLGARTTSLVSQAQNYEVDRLFRGETAAVAPSRQEARAEAARILLIGMGRGDMPAADRSYLAQLVAARTGLAADAAQARVDATLAAEKDAATKARAAADTARKSASAAAIFTGLAMLIGAFIACAAAALGGSLRDEHA